MPERLVDVSGSNRTVLHTFPITLSGSDGEVMPKDTEYEEKALRAAAHAQLVPNADLENLTTRMHASRSGQLEPFGDDRDVLSQTKARPGSGRSRARLPALGDGWLSAWGCR